MFNLRYEEMYLYILLLLANKAKRDIESDRTGTGTAREFGLMLNCDLRQDFPLLTTKKIFTRGVVEELLWFLRGETNIKSLLDAKVHIWDEWATENGDLGPVYGAMWRNWNGQGIDQIADLITELKTRPNSRRMIVTGWNPEVLPDPLLTPKANALMDKQALPPCHTMWQCFAQEMSDQERLQWVSDNGRDELRGHSMNDLTKNGVPTHWLDLQLYQRSADWFLGVPFNAVSYSLLLMLIARHVNMVPRRFIHTFGDYHLYSNHIEQAEEQLARDMKNPARVEFTHDPATPLEDIQSENIKFKDYQPHPSIKAAVSV